MPELPDLCVYQDALRQRIVPHPLQKITIGSPFLLRTANPPLTAIEGVTVTAVSLTGKRIIWRFDNDLFLIFHLMIAGRLRWWKTGDKGRKPAGKIVQATFEFPHGELFFTEASKKKRASLHLVQGRSALAEHDRGGAEVLDLDLAAFTQVLQRENHTLKRALTDPRLFSGIGNAYSDEILCAAGLSPMKQTQSMNADEIEGLFDATQSTLEYWIARLAAEFGDRFPGAGEITAFRPEFSVHGKFGQDCLRCGTKVQRIRYAANETNYCPGCQTGGKLLADRSLSRLLKKDWPKSIDEL